MTPPLARLSGITKLFGPVRALDGADLQVLGGEITGVLGENGAGKTTLLNVLGGMLVPEAGTVEIEGQAVTLRRPRDAWRAGVAMVHQHFTLVPTLSVLENLALGYRRSAWGMRLGYEQLRAEVRELVERTGLAVPLAAPVHDLGVGERQRVEILKALLRRPRMLILDEPTAVLTPGEVEVLFGLLRELAARGTGVVLVAHKLDEVLDVANRVTVLRDGRTVFEGTRAEVDAPTLTRAMVGRGHADPVAIGHVDGAVRRSGNVHGEGPVAKLERVSLGGARGEEALRGVSIQVRRGEIVGVAGVEGNGQRELALVLSGRAQPAQGVADVPPGVGFVPQDRTREGLAQDFDLVENVALAVHRDPTFQRGPLLRWSAVEAKTRELVRRFGVRAGSLGSEARTLSGGNQQRLVVARELEAATDLFVAENPTRGLDVEAASFVHEELGRIRDRRPGPGIVLVSTDLDEVLALSDRVFVMVRGALHEVAEADRTREAVGALMLSGAHA